MRPGENEQVWSIPHFFVNDHRRLDALLQAAVIHAEHVDQCTFTQLRAGLLSHIGIEEKIFLPADQ
ncbi:MAG: hypothetical protein ABI604_11650 [Nitrospirota bacterium]